MLTQLNSLLRSEVVALESFQTELERCQGALQLMGDGINEPGLPVEHTDLTYEKNAEQDEDRDDHHEGCAPEGEKPDQREVLDDDQDPADQERDAERDAHDSERDGD